MKKKILITSALMYANGDLHIGHIYEVIQADIWRRFKLLCEEDCIYICGDDAHGTPIMIEAKKKTMQPEELVNFYHVRHKKDIIGFNVHLDNFYLTHSKENQDLTNLFYEKFKEKDDIIKEPVMQAYDETNQMFLPDRYVKGTCPSCFAEDQYGDNCEQCGKVYLVKDLIAPRSTLSNDAPIFKNSTHYFFNLPKYETFLLDWIKNSKIQQEVKNKLLEWFKTGLQSFDISRDEPYFGFKIPGDEKKYFYVWLDAPIGYISITKNLLEKNKNLEVSNAYKDYWSQENSKESEIYHFIGKDIINFHGIFWPAMLKSADFKLPDNIFVHGYVMINGSKMSKSRNTFILASEYLKYLNPEYLRYYFASKTKLNTEDIDLDFANFKQVINSELIGKIINILSRSSKFISLYFDNKLSNEAIDIDLINIFISQSSEIIKLYETINYSAVTKKILELADLANKYIDEYKPWVLIKDSNTFNKVHMICTNAIRMFYVIMIYIKPILPIVSANFENFLQISELKWDDVKSFPYNQCVKNYVPLLERISDEDIQHFASN